jgi:hypothetical protein
MAKTVVPARAMGAERIIRELRTLYPAQRLLLEAGRLAAYESEALTAFAVRPRAVVIPETADEMIRETRCSIHLPQDQAEPAV